MLNVVNIQNIIIVKNGFYKGIKSNLGIYGRASFFLKTSVSRVSGVGVPNVGGRSGCFSA
jgi:hypothetical protein